jgi:hypothetical protein
MSDAMVQDRRPGDSEVLWLFLFLHLLVGRRQRADRPALTFRTAHQVPLPR